MSTLIRAASLAICLTALAVPLDAQGSKAPKNMLKPKAITNGLGAGFFCVSAPAANVHNLGWLSANSRFRVEFESTSTSDPIATLSAHNFNGAEATGEMSWSDDEGGQLNPKFELSKPYHASWVLTVSSADGDPACYTYRLTVLSAGS